VIKLLRTVLEAATPGVVVVTETNVPHAENVAYFGDGRDEAQMVYNFALPPLTLHAIATGDARVLRDWAATGLRTPSDETAFFNFLASHDGIGVRPVEGILPRDQVGALAERVLARGGRVSRKTDVGGGESPYELNVSLFDALADPDAPEDDGIRRLLAAHALMLACPACPACTSTRCSGRATTGPPRGHGPRALHQPGPLRPRDPRRPSWWIPTVAGAGCSTGCAPCCAPAPPTTAFHPSSPGALAGGAPLGGAVLRGAPGTRSWRCSTWPATGCGSTGPPCWADAGPRAPATC
jgi:hypothetical protein